MRWPVAVLVGYFFMGLEMAVRDRLGVSGTALSPSFAMIFVVFVALFAPTLPALWTGLLVGLAVDIATPRGDGALVILGPNAIGFLAAAYLVLTMRGLMMRRNPFALAFLAVLASMLANIVIVTVFTVRLIWVEPYDFLPLTELGQRLLGSLLTGVAALLLSLILFPMLPLFHFADPHARRFAARK